MYLILFMKIILIRNPRSNFNMVLTTQIMFLLINFFLTKYLITTIDNIENIVNNLNEVFFTGFNFIDPLKQVKEFRSDNHPIWFTRRLEK